MEIAAANSLRWNSGNAPRISFGGNLFVTEKPATPKPLVTHASRVTSGFIRAEQARCAAPAHPACCRKEYNDLAYFGGSDGWTDKHRRRTYCLEIRCSPRFSPVTVSNKESPHCEPPPAKLPSSVVQARPELSPTFLACAWSHRAHRDVRRIPGVRPEPPAKHR